MIFFRLSCGLVKFHRSSAVSNGVGVFELLVYFCPRRVLARRPKTEEAP